MQHWDASIVPAKKQTDAVYPDRRGLKDRVGLRGGEQTAAVRSSNTNYSDFRMWVKMDAPEPPMF
jgi:hypothetical protein